MGLETTLKRPIINTRDEPHADPEKYRRLHVIIGDANLAEISTYLKIGTTALVLAMIEDGFLTDDLSVDAPGAARCTRSRHDPTLSHLVTLRDGRKMTASSCRWSTSSRPASTSRTSYGADADDVTARRARPLGVGAHPAGRRPDAAVDRSSTGSPSCELLEGYRERDGPGLGRRASCSWSTCSTPTCGRTRASTTGSWRAGACRPLHHRATRVGAADDRAAGGHPRLLPRPLPGQVPGTEVAAASWDSVIFDLPGRESLQRVPTLEPLRGTKAHVGDLIDRCATATELVAALTERTDTLRLDRSSGAVRETAWRAADVTSQVMSAQRRRLRVSVRQLETAEGQMADEGHRRSAAANAARRGRRGRDRGDRERATSQSARRSSTRTSTRSSTRSTRCSRRTPRSSSGRYIQKGGQ